MIVNCLFICIQWSVNGGAQRCTNRRIGITCTHDTPHRPQFWDFKRTVCIRFLYTYSYFGGQILIMVRVVIHVCHRWQSDLAFLHLTVRVISKCIQICLLPIRGTYNLYKGAIIFFRIGGSLKSWGGHRIFS